MKKSFKSVTDQVLTIIQICNFYNSKTRIRILRPDARGLTLTRTHLIGQIQILRILGDFPGSLYDRSLLSDNKSLNMLKTYPWEEPHEIF